MQDVKKTEDKSKSEDQKPMSEIPGTDHASLMRAFRNSDKQSISELKWLPLLPKLSLFSPGKSLSIFAVFFSKSLFPQSAAKMSSKSHVNVALLA